MFSARYDSEPAIVCSNDYGKTWYELPDSYGFQNVYPHHIDWYTLRRFLGVTSDGYAIVQHSPLQGLNPSITYMIKIINKN